MRGRSFSTCNRVNPPGGPKVRASKTWLKAPMPPWNLVARRRLLPRQLRSQTRPRLQSPSPPLLAPLTLAPAARRLPRGPEPGASPPSPRVSVRLGGKFLEMPERSPRLWNSSHAWLSRFGAPRPAQPPGLAPGAPTCAPAAAPPAAPSAGSLCESLVQSLGQTWEERAPGSGAVRTAPAPSVSPPHPTAPPSGIAQAQPAGSPAAAGPEPAGAPEPPPPPLTMGSGPGLPPPLGLCLWLCVLVLSAGASGSSGVRKRGPTVTAKVTSPVGQRDGSFGEGVRASGSRMGQGTGGCARLVRGHRSRRGGASAGGGGGPLPGTWGAKARAPARPRRRLLNLTSQAGGPRRPAPG